MICPKNPCEILAKSILPRKKDIHPLRCDFSGESKDKPSDLGEKSPPRTPDPGASQRAFAAQDYGDLREHLAAVVIPSHFHGWEIFIPNGSKWYSRSLCRLSQHDDSYLIVVFLFDFCWSVSLLTLFPQKYQTFDRQHSCRVLSTVGRKPVQSKFMKWPFSHL